MVIIIGLVTMGALVWVLTSTMARETVYTPAIGTRVSSPDETITQAA
jgi:hypothetical protein